jgi:uncharacterized membrane protein
MRPGLSGGPLGQHTEDQEMTEETTPATREGEADRATSEAQVGLATDGAYYLVVGQFPTDAEAQAVYATLEDIEQRTSLRIDAVVIASADAEGKITLHEATEHSTKTGLKWGVVGGVVLGVIFPPSVLASAVGFGVVGSVLGKIRNLSHRSHLKDELAGVIAPGTTGLIVLAEDTAVVEIEKALARAERIVTKAVDKELSREIDREAAAAKEAVTSN